MRVIALTDVEDATALKKGQLNPSKRILYVVSKERRVKALLVRGGHLGCGVYCYSKGE